MIYHNYCRSCHGSWKSDTTVARPKCPSCRSTQINIREWALPPDAYRNTKKERKTPSWMKIYAAGMIIVFLMMIISSILILMEA